VEGLVYGAVVTISVLVENVGVSMGESTSLDILTGETDMVPLLNQGRKGKSLTRTPINSLLIDD